eukprot:tig00000248_g21828.t1
MDSTSLFWTIPPVSRADPEETDALALERGLPLVLPRLCDVCAFSTSHCYAASAYPYGAGEGASTCACPGCSLPDPSALGLALQLGLSFEFGCGGPCDQAGAAPLELELAYACEPFMIRGSADAATSGFERVDAQPRGEDIEIDSEELPLAADLNAFRNS